MKKIITTIAAAALVLTVGVTGALAAGPGGAGRRRAAHPAIMRRLCAAMWMQTATASAITAARTVRRARAAGSILIDADGQRHL